MNSNSNEAIFGPRSEVACPIHGSRHHARSRENRICTATVEMYRQLVSPANIAEHAHDLRLDGDHHFARYQKSGTQFRLEEARRAYAKARAWETGEDAAELLGSDVAQAMALTAKGLI